MTQMKLLFTNVGRRTYMVEFAREIIKSKILVSDAESIIPSFYLENVNKYLIPKIKKNKKKYLQKLLFLVKKLKIKKIIPLSDHDLIALAENKLKFKKLGCDVIISGPSFVKMCMNKKQMYFFCKKIKLIRLIHFF